MTAGEGRRRWRALDLGTVQAVLEADAPRVNCPEHGPTVVAVPWARHAGRAHPRLRRAGGLAGDASARRRAVTELMRIAWRTVGRDRRPGSGPTSTRRVDRLAGLRRIGIDEISYKRGHKYLTVVVDHDTGRLVWAAPGRDTRHPGRRSSTPSAQQRCAQITHVRPTPRTGSRTWSRPTLPATRCAAPTRSTSCSGPPKPSTRSAAEAWNEARDGARRDRRHRRHRTAGSGAAPGHARQLKRARWALWKNPEDLTEPPAREAAPGSPRPTPACYRGLPAQGRPAAGLPARGRSRQTRPATGGSTGPAAAASPPSSTSQRRIRRNTEPRSSPAIEHGLSNGLIESTNTKIRLLTRIAFGFTNPDALIALAMLSLGGHRPTLPGRT